MKHLYKFIFFCFLVSQAYIYGQICPTLKDQHGGFGGSVKLDCNYLNTNNCIDLFATFPTLSGSETYNVSSTPYAPYANYAGGQVLDIYGSESIRDEDFVKRINFNDSQFFGSKAFVFSYYGKVYDSFIISSNGFITFRNDLQENDYSPSDFEGHQIPSANLPKLAIFGVYQDLEFVKGESTISIDVVDDYPCRKLVINFNNVRIVGTNQHSTSQIVLQELTSVVDIFVKDKPTPDSTANRKSAIIGLTDNSYQGIAAPGRNGSVWAASNEGWRFQPSGADMLRNIQWFNNGQKLGGNDNKLQVNVCPKLDVEQYSAKAFYKLKNGDVLEVEKEIVFKFSLDYPLVKDVTQPICNGAVTTYHQNDFYESLLVPSLPNNEFGVRGSSAFNYKFYLSPSDAELGIVPPLNPAVALDNNVKYHVRVENKTNPACYRVAFVKIEDATDALLTHSVQVCESMKKDYDLSKLLCQLFDSSFQPTAVKFRIDSPTGAFVTKADLTGTTKIYVVATTSCGDITLGPIDVVITTGPPILSIPDPIMINICDVVIPGMNPPLRETDFKWTKFFKDHSIVFTADPDAIITVHQTEDDAKNNIGIMNYVDEGDPLKDYTYELWVRITPSEQDTTLCKTQCSSIVKINVKAQFEKIIVNINDADEDSVPDDPTKFDTEDANIYLCKSAVDRQINLDADFQNIIKVTQPVNAVGLTKRFYANLDDAILDTLGVANILPQQILLANEVSKTFYAKYSKGTDPDSRCYVIVRLVYSVETFPVLNPTNPIIICTKNNEAVTKNLIDYTNQILATMIFQQPKPDVKYYEDSAGTNEITQVSLDSTTPIKSVFVKITSGYNTSCQSDLLEYKFSLKSIDVLKDEITVSINCDDNADGKIFVDLTKYAPQFLTDPTDVNNKVQYFRNFNPTTNFLSNEIIGSLNNFELPFSGQETIYLKIGKTTSDCYTVAKIIFNVNVTNTPIKLKDKQYLLRCNVTNQILDFNLEEIIPKIYDETNPPLSGFITHVYFYESQSDAEADVVTARIPNPTVYPLNVTDVRKVLWVRFESNQGCYSVKSFGIRITNPNETDFAVKPEPKIPICNDKLDGNYTFNLRDWVNAKIANSLPGNSFLNDYEATLGVKFTFHISPTSPALTPDEEINFHPDPFSNSFVWIQADGGGGDCAHFMKLDFDFGDVSTMPFTISNFCVYDKIDLNQIKNDPRIASASNLEFYLTEADLIAGNKIPNDTQFLIGDLTSVFVKIIFPGSQCPRKGIITFNPKVTPIFTMQDNEIYYCKSLENAYIKIDPSNIFNLGLTPVSYKILGPDGSETTGAYTDPLVLSTNKEGVYKVTIIANNGCSYTADPVTLIPYDVPVITNIIVDINSVQVIATAANPNRTIEYTYESFGSWQTSNVFVNVPKGIRKFYVRYADNQSDNNCISSATAAYVLSAQNVITPNADGINDTWKISELGFFNGQNTTMQIYDRYNRLVFEKSSNTEIIWDGKIKGAPLPTATYWYVIKTPDGNQRNGWILLKNRE
ncbi:T9SS type B sorting domain-containing protein [Soonwooa sp.]|uniref:T9SS type B sorting domain-containing protein n=1 Tax=Soonwooa sp. TaxID=1938592 RepID=UPI00260302CD|nr:T9SS type B sorting domain-containing protein [Soonwooa sp.]